MLDLEIFLLSFPYFFKTNPNIFYFSRLFLSKVTSSRVPRPEVPCQKNLEIRNLEINK